MSDKKYISVNELCSSYQVDFSFISSLNEYGLVEITIVEETPVIEENYLRELEKLVRLHTDLHINLEGIDAISHLLQRISGLQEEVKLLQNKVRRYED